MSAKNNSLAEDCQLQADKDSVKNKIDGVEREDLAVSVSGTACQRTSFFLIISDPLRDSVPMDAQRLGSFGKMFFVAGECLLDVELFEFGYGFGEQNMAVQHFVNQGFESGAHLFKNCG
jgi:hypothetical protein